jgi:integrase
MRFREPFTLLKRKRRGGGFIWYYRLSSDPKRVAHSTGTSNKGLARSLVDKMLTQEEPAEAGQTLRQFIEPYYVWDTCPHVRRLSAEGKQIGHAHVLNCRRLLERNVFKDAIADRQLLELRRADFIDFRDRLALVRGPRTVNSTMAVLKAALQEGEYREEIPKNPALKIGSLQYQKRERGVFLQAELLALFGGDPPGPWRDLQARTCFLLAWSCGMRRGELYALRWRHIDLETRILRVDEAWKGGEEIGAPKWGRRREAPLAAAVVTSLQELRDDSLHTLPDDLIFCEDSGEMRSEQWWRDCFAEAMAAVKVGEDVGIDVRARHLSPHSFRHTINTQLLNEEIDPGKIRDMLGWTNISTQDGYTHRRGEDLRESADVVDRFLGKK